MNKKTISRRSFLAGSLAASCWGLGGCCGFPGILSCKSPNSKLCHACIGTANMAGWDLEQFLNNPTVQVTALCDVDRTFLAAAAKKVPGARLYTDWREMLAKEGDALDSVNVSTPDHTHTVITSGALRAGKHVYCQKPLCKRLDECRYLRDLAVSSGKVTQLGTQLAAGITDRTCIKVLEDGVLGPIRRVMLFSTRNGKVRIPRVQPVTVPTPETLNWDVWIGPQAMRPFSTSYHPQGWRLFHDFGTGWIGDLCIHIINAPWMGLGLGKTAPVAVRAEVDAAALDPSTKGMWPLYSHITWEMPGVKASGMKPFALEWYSGLSLDPKTPANFLPPQVCHEVAKHSLSGKLPLEGRVVEGEAGWMLVPHGGDGEKQGAPTLVMKDGKPAPALPKIEAAPSHFDEFVLRCREGGKARSDFSTVESLMEAVLMGSIAEQLPNHRHVWNAATRTFDTPEATALTKSAYRAGWEIAGLDRA